MLNYSKTELGFQVLKDRSIVLNARQRQLLLLIGTDDLIMLSSNIQTRIAQPEILNSLYELGLVFNKNKTNETENKFLTKPFQNATETLSQTLPTSLEIINTEIPIENIEQSKELNSFSEVKALMIHTLEQYCGLLAKPIIKKIENTDSFESLKTCRMQWITHLQESRINPKQLNNYLQQINSSLTKITHN